MRDSERAATASQGSQADFAEEIRKEAIVQAYRTRILDKGKPTPKPYEPPKTVVCPVCFRDVRPRKRQQGEVLEVIPGWHRSRSHSPKWCKGSPRQGRRQ